MSRTVDIAVTFGACFAFLVGITVRAGWDFTHPRLWEHFGNDPHVYAWPLAFAWVLFGSVFTDVVGSERRRRRRARVAGLVQRAQELIRENRLPEAAACLAEAKALSGYQDN